MITMPAPQVSVIVPCYNEEKTIRTLLDGLVSQTFPKELMEVVIADGMSSDRTRVYVSAFQKEHPALSVQVVDNPRRTIPAALNRAIAAANGDVIIRMDAHSQPEEDYVARCVSALEGGRGENVGGVWQIRPGAQTWIAKAIARAAAHPLGVGDAQYRHTTRAQEVDTVPFGAFRRSLVDEIGPFDETLLTNEDYEFNVRIRRAGGKIWLDPAIRTAYFARATLRELARQYLRYGFWKGRMLKRYPSTLRPRQLLPPLFVLGLTAGALLALAWPPAAWLYVPAVLAYVLLLLGAGVQSAWKAREPGHLIGVPAAIAVMHVCWGSALLWSLVRR